MYVVHVFWGHGDLLNFVREERHKFSRSLREEYVGRNDPISGQVSMRELLLRGGIAHRSAVERG